jgi:hypothetical protein
MPKQLLVRVEQQRAGLVGCGQANLPHLCKTEKLLFLSVEELRLRKDSRCGRAERRCGSLVQHRGGLGQV